MEISKEEIESPPVRAVVEKSQHVQFQLVSANIIFSIAVIIIRKKTTTTIEVDYNVIRNRFPEI